MPAAYTYSYPRPALTADVLVFALRQAELQVLLIQRAREPFAQCWALPGGFVNENEKPIAAARRELHEETGVTADSLEVVGVFGDPGRDPRGWTVTILYSILIQADRLQLRAADDARTVAWHPLTALPRLAFDHERLLAAGLAQLRSAPVLPLIRAGYLTEPFTKTELRDLWSSCLGTKLNASTMKQLFRGPGQLERVPHAAGARFRWILPCPPSPTSSGE